MAGATLGIVGVLLLLAVLLFLRIPVGFAMALVGFTGLAEVIGPKAALNLVSREIWETFSSYGLTVIPLFTFMGTLAFYCGISERLYGAAHRWVGHVRGGIAMTTILACAGFSAICGSNTATAATMSSIALPEMARFRYNPVLSTGSVACGSTLGVVIPPSIVLIVIGLYTGQSISKLFFGAVVPGLVLTGFFLLTVYIASSLRKDWGPPASKAPWSERMRSLPGALEMIALFFFIMGGLYLGWFTASEAGAAGALGVIVLGLLGRTLTWGRFKMALLDALKTSSMIMMIVTGAVIFGRFLTITRLPYQAAQWAASLPVSPSLILVVILAIYLVGGAVMDALAFLLVTLPIFYPLATSMGYDPIWYGVVITVMTTLGAVTPPVGVNTYIVAGNAEEVSLKEVFKGVSLFFPAYAASLALMILFPQVVLFLPRMMQG